MAIHASAGARDPFLAGQSERGDMGKKIAVLGSGAQGSGIGVDFVRAGFADHQTRRTRPLPDGRGFMPQNEVIDTMLPHLNRLPFSLIMISTK